jgi:hypothetical protein
VALFNYLGVFLFCLFLLGLGVFHQIGFDERVYLSVHHALYVAALVIGAVVFYPTVVEHVASYLGAPLDFLLPLFDRGFFI